MPLLPGPRPRLLTAAIAALGVLVAGPALAEAPTAAEGSGLHLDTVSSAPDLVTGGDALVEISSEHNFPHDRVEVTLNGKDVTTAFTWDGSREVLVGRIDGMDQGENLLRAALPGGARGADELSVSNHPDEGPLFSGPHEQPFTCETQDFEAPEPTRRSASPSTRTARSRTGSTTSTTRRRGPGRRSRRTPPPTPTTSHAPRPTTGPRCRSSCASPTAPPTAASSSTPRCTIRSPRIR